MDDTEIEEKNTSPFDLPAPLFVRAWVIACLIISAIMFLAFVFEGPIQSFFGVIWDFLRYLARPII